MSKKAPKKKLKDVIKKNKIVDVFLGFIGKHEKIEKKKLHESDETEHDVDDLHNHLSGHYSFHSYKDDHLARAIRRYTGSMANYVNARKLHQNGIKNPKAEYPKHMRRHEWEEVNRHEKNLSAALQKHTTPTDFHVFTGMSFSPEHHAGAEFRMPAWTSTSIDKHRAGMFSKPIPGSKYTYSRNIFNSDDIKQVHPATLKAHEKKTEIARNTIFKNPENLKKYTDAENTHGFYPIFPGYKPASIGGDPNHPKAGWTTGDTELDKHAHNLNLRDTGTRQINPYKHMMKIHIPKGAHGAYIADHSDYAEEKEFLLHHGAKVRVHHEPEIDHDNKTVIWNAKLSHDGIKPTKFADFSKMRRPTIDRPSPSKHGQMSLFERRMIHNVIQRMLAR